MNTQKVCDLSFGQILNSIAEEDEEYVMEIIRDNKFSHGDYFEIAKKAVEQGKLNILRSLLDSHLISAVDVIMFSVEKLTIELLEVFAEKKISWPPEVYFFAAKDNKLEVLDYLMKYKHRILCPIFISAEDQVVYGASEGGHVHILEKYSTRRYWNVSTMINAIRGGHLECVKFLHERGVTITSPYCLFDTCVSKERALEVENYMNEHDFVKRVCKRCIKERS